MGHDSPALHIVLIIENENDAHSIERAIAASDLQVEVTLYVQPETALLLLNDQAYLNPEVEHLILCEHPRPGMDGLQLHRDIQQKRLPASIILLLKDAAEISMVDVHKAGITDYLIQDPEYAYVQLLPDFISQVAARRQQYTSNPVRRSMLKALVRIQKTLLGLGTQADLSAAWVTLAQLLVDLLPARRVAVFDYQHVDADTRLLYTRAEWQDGQFASDTSAAPRAPVAAQHLLPSGAESRLRSGEIFTQTLDAPGGKPRPTRFYLPLLTDAHLSGIVVIEQEVPMAQMAPAMLDFLQAIAVDLSLWHQQHRTAERLQAYAGELRQQNEELHGFAYMVAHDLKNPLTIVTSTAQALSQMFSTLTQAEVEELASMLQEYSDKAVSIVDELLLLASTRREDIQAEPVAMEPIVQRALKQIHNLIDTSHATIELPDQWPSAQGHAPWLEAVWVNYISNGLKYGGRPPRLQLGGEFLPDNTVRYWIQDNGDGLTPEEQQEIFTAFTRFSQYRSPGHGLGLTIVRHVVTKLGGTVGVYSTGKAGEGSRFYFTLPAAE